MHFADQISGVFEYWRNISEPFHINSSSLPLMKSVEITMRQLMTGVYGPVAEHPAPRNPLPWRLVVTLARCTDGQRGLGPGNCSGDLDAVPGPGCCCCCWHSLVLPPTSSVGLCLSPAPAPCTPSPGSDTSPHLVTSKWRLPDQPLL